MTVDADIAELNLEPISFKVCVDERWDIEEIDAVESEYRAFLHAVRHHPQMELAPSRKMDVFWHHHILDTQKYIEDCDKLFGRYVHHYPYSGVLSASDAQRQNERFTHTQELLRDLRQHKG